MMPVGGGTGDRVAQAGADVLGIAQTSVWVVVEGPALGVSRAHPAWALCRGLGATGFGGIHLRGGEDHSDELSLLLQDVGFTQGAALGPGHVLADDAPACDILLHLGSEGGSRDLCAGFAAASSARFASLSWAGTSVAMTSGSEVSGGVATPEPGDGIDLEPLAPIGRIAAGLALQEALIFAGQLRPAALPDPEVSFDAAAESRTCQVDAPLWPPVRIEDSIIEVIGAGAVGTNLLESLAPLLGPGCELRIVDFDEVGPENVAVQPAFSVEDVGRPKATAMAEKLAPLCDPALDIRPMVMRCEDRPRTLGRPSLRIACPDRFAVRKHLNDCASRRSEPRCGAICRATPPASSTGFPTSPNALRSSSTGSPVRSRRR
jgi:hypothetical protein